MQSTVETFMVAKTDIGTSFDAVQAVLQQQKSVILDIDMQGVLQLQAIKDKLDPRPCVIFVAPPNIQELEKRLRTRGTETAESIELRLQAAHKELEWGMRPNSVDFVIVNDDLEIAFDKLEEIVSKV
jgi:guanylate kinase